MDPVNDEEQKDLPKPELDLPLPEKELESGEDETTPSSDKYYSEENIKNLRKSHPIVKNQTPPKESHLLRWFLVGFLFIGLLAIMEGGVYLYKNSSKSISIHPLGPDSYKGSPTPDPTSDWQTYRGKEFSFSYPTDWSFYTYGKTGEVIPGSQYGEFFLSPDSKNKSTSIDINIEPVNQTNLEKQQQSRKNWAWNNFKISSIKIGDVDATQFSGEINGVDRKSVLFEKDGYIYILDSLDGDTSTFNQILSTFKFINSSDQTTNWKTFTGKNFEISIPKDLNPATDPITYSSSVHFNEKQYFTNSNNTVSLTVQVTSDPYPLSKVPGNVENITLDSEPAVKLNVVSGLAGNLYQPSIQTNHNNLRYYLFLSTEDNALNRQQADKVMNHLISTFKFVQ